MSARAGLQLSDISDLRAYERERDDFRRRVIELKRRRRVQVGELVTLVFENRETVRFQIQEMARIEKLMTDEAIQAEIDVYDVLVPGAGQLCATVFVELTTDELLREWLPRLVGIERSIAVRTAGGTTIRAVPEEQHAERLTRDDITSTVHYIRFELTDDEVASAAAGRLVVAIDHPAYQFETELTNETRDELLGDLRGS